MMNIQVLFGTTPPTLEMIPTHDFQAAAVPTAIF